MKLNSIKSKKLTKPDFRKKAPSGQEGPKNPRTVGFCQKSNSFTCTFLEYESIIVFMVQKLLDHSEFGIL